MEIDYESLKDYYDHEAIMDLEEKYLEGSEEEGGDQNQEMNEEWFKLVNVHVNVWSCK